MKNFHGLFCDIVATDVTPIQFTERRMNEWNASHRDSEDGHRIFFHKPPRVLPLEDDGYHGDMPWYEMYTENNNKNNNNNNDTRIWRGMAKQLLTARSISSSSFPLCWLCRLINFSHYQKCIHPVGFCFSADYCYCWLLVVDFMSIRQSWRIFEWMNVGMGPANECLVAVQIAESRELYI